jgi:hypothetical protein
MEVYWIEIFRSTIRRSFQVSTQLNRWFLVGFWHPPSHDQELTTMHTILVNKVNDGTDLINIGRNGAEKGAFLAIETKASIEFTEHAHPSLIRLR